MWSILEWIALSSSDNRKSLAAGIKSLWLPPLLHKCGTVKWTVHLTCCPLKTQGSCWGGQQRLFLCNLGWERRRKGQPATQAFMLSCTASCYSNVPLHSFSPAGFDQFGLFVPKCLAAATSLTPTDLQRSTLTSGLLEVTDVSGCSNTPPTEKSTPANDSRASFKRRRLRRAFTYGTFHPNHVKWQNLAICH